MNEFYSSQAIPALERVQRLLKEMPHTTYGGDFSNRLRLRARQVWCHSSSEGTVYISIPLGADDDTRTFRRLPPCRTARLLAAGECDLTLEFPRS